MKRGELMCTAILEEESTVTSRTTCLDMNLIEESVNCHKDRSDGCAWKRKQLLILQGAREGENCWSESRHIYPQIIH
jgi:hypothetical protein